MSDLLVDILAAMLRAHGREEVRAALELAEERQHKPTPRRKRKRAERTDASAARAAREQSGKDVSELARERARRSLRRQGLR